MHWSRFSLVQTFAAGSFIRGLFAVLALTVCGPGAATLITFKEFAPRTQVTGQHESLGLLIDGGAIIPWEGVPASSPVVPPAQALADFYGPNLHLRLIGVLPTMVSMYVTTVFGGVVSLNAYGSGGLIDHAVTAGWAEAEKISTPAVPREFAELFSPTGVQRVVREALHFRRGDLYIDNLSFAAALPVKEPTAVSLALISIAIASLGIYVLRRKPSLLS